MQVDLEPPITATLASDAAQLFNGYTAECALDVRRAGTNCCTHRCCFAIGVVTHRHRGRCEQNRMLQLLAIERHRGVNLSQSGHHLRGKPGFLPCDFVFQQRLLIAGPIAEVVPDVRRYVVASQ